MSKINKYKLLRIEKMLERYQQSGEIKQVIFPNKVQIGLGQGDKAFEQGVNVYGVLTVSGAIHTKTGSYISFGKRIGPRGYGFREHAGNMQFKNPPTSVVPNPDWTDIDSAGVGMTSFYADGDNTSPQTVSNNDTLLIAGGTALTTVAAATDTITINLDNTAVTPNTYGDGTNVPQFTVDQQGRITAVSNIQISASGLSIRSGSTTVSSVGTLDVTNIAIPGNLGGGIVALTGSIGESEDGSYADGLFTDFNSSTPVGTAVDRFNEVLKGLAPQAAPALDDMDSDDTGVSANLSFGSSQSIAGYTNAGPSSLTPASSLSNVDINGAYDSVIAGNDIRSACFAGSTIIEGTLNADISADSPNYPAGALGDGNTGTLYLYANDNSNAIHSVDLSSFGSGDSLNANGSGFFDLSAADPGHFSDGSEFNTFIHRTGSLRVHTLDQQEGWNYARVTHVVGSTTNTCNYVEWVNDSDSNALVAAGSALDTLSMTGLNTLSGVRYNTAGTAEYRVRATNAYRNIYSQETITFNGTECSVPSQAFPTINYAGGESETKTLHITGSSTITGDPLLNESITVSVNVPHPLKSNLSTAGSESISGILLYDLSNTSTSTSETFRLENYRKVSGSYNAQADVTDNAAIWISSKHMSGTNTGYEDGLLFYNSRLYSPLQGAASGDFRNINDGGSIANGPGENVNYSTIQGQRTFYRYFQNTSGGSKTDFSLTIKGSGTIVSHGTSLGTGNISVLVRLPSTSTNQVTGWMDLAVAFATGQTSDNDGCLNGNLDTILDATNDATFGTQSVGSNEYIMVKVQVDAAFTGYISSMSVSWS